jgi:AAA15 family ATPase/GTPase
MEVFSLLLEYSFKNFLSFKDEMYFSLRSTENLHEKFPDNYISDKNILKSAIIVGENAGGKSNFIKSLSYLQFLFKKNQPIESALKNVYDGYNFGNKTKIIDTTQRFFIAILIDDCEYHYELEIDCLGIKQEIFSQIPLNQTEENKIFIMERNESNISLTDTMDLIQLANRGDQPLIKLNYELKVNPTIDENLRNILKRNERDEHDGLNISKLAILGIKSAVVFSKWINENLFINISPDGEQYSQVKVLSKDDIHVLNDKEKFLPILRLIDPSISDFKLDNKSPFAGTVIVRVDENNRRYEHDLISDSAGVRDFFPLAIQIFKIVYQNKVVFADEMDHSLNPVLTDKILSFIHGSEHTGQFIFTTHNVLHLNLENYTKEQIYFVTKNSNTLQSELYSLADFPDIDYDIGIDLYKFYLRGVLGGTLNE